MIRFLMFLITLALSAGVVEARSVINPTDGSIRNPGIDDGGNTDRALYCASDAFFLDKAGGVDTNTCKSEAQACKTFSKMSSIKSQMGPDDCLLLKRGEEWLNDGSAGSFILNIPQGNATNNLFTMGSYGTGARPKLRWTSGAPAMRIDNRHYFRIERIDFEAHKSFGVLNGSSNATWYQSKWTAPTDLGFKCSGETPNGVGLNIPQYITLKEVEIIDIGTNLSPPTSGIGEGIYLSANDGPEKPINKLGCYDFTLIDSRMSNIYNNAVSFKRSTRNIHIKGNLFENMRLGDDSGIVTSRNADQPDGANLIEGNVFRNSHYLGTKSSDMSAIVAGAGTTVRNNLVIYQTGVNGATAFTAVNAFSNLNNTFFYYNTTHGNATNGFKTINTMPTANIYGNLGVQSTYANNKVTDSTYYVDATKAGAVFRLKPTATAVIDQLPTAKGTNTDIEGGARPFGATRDYGAFEYGSAQSGGPVDPVCPITVATNFYVSKTGLDSNPCGTQALPFLTIQKCIAFAKANFFAGHACNVGAGVYAENLTIAAIVGSAPDQGFTLRPTPGAAVTVQPASGVNVLRITDDSKFITIDGSPGTLIFDGTSATGSTLLFDGYLGPVASSADNLLMKQIEVRNGPGIGIEGTAGTSDITYENVSVHNKASHGIVIRARHSAIRGSSIYSNGGSGVRYEVQAGSIPNDALIEKSRIYSNTASGVFSADGNDHKIVNNLIYTNTGTGITLEDVAVTAAQVHHNSLSGNGTGISIGATVTGATLVSNAAFGNTTAQIVDAGTGNTLTTNLTTTPGWTNAAGGDFTITRFSPAYNGGQCSPLVLQDFVDTGRPQPVGGQCDQGAYEVVSSGVTTPIGWGVTQVAATGSGLQSITIPALGSSTPRFAFFQMGSVVTNGTDIAHGQMGFGFTDGVSQYTIMCSAEGLPNNNPTDTDCGMFDTRAIGIADFTGTTGADICMASFSSFDPGGITINWNGVACPQPYKINVTLIAGDDLYAQAFSPTVPATSQTVAQALPFEADYVFGMRSRETDYLGNFTNPSFVFSLVQGINLATDLTKSMGIGWPNGLAVPTNNAMVYDGGYECGGPSCTGGPTLYTIGNYSPAGFDFVYTAAAQPGPRPFFALQFGTLANTLQNLTMPAVAGAGSQSYSLGFEPGLMWCTMSNIQTVGTANTAAGGGTMGFFVTDFINTYSIGWNQQAVTNPPMATLMNTGFELNSTTNTQLYAGTVAPTPTGVTFNFTNKPGTADVWTCHAIADPSPLLVVTTPTGLTAGGSNGIIALTWDPTLYATAYRVFRATALGGPYTQIAETVDPQYQDAIGYDGQTYYYQVTAGNEQGFSSPTVAVSAVAPAFTLEIGQDAYICNSPPEACGYGERTYLVTRRSTSTEFRSLLQFTAQALPFTQVQNATLELKAIAKSATVPLKVFQTADISWDEVGVTWANQPPLQTELAALSLTTLGPVTVNVTTALQEAIANRAGVLSLAVAGSDTSNAGVQWISREADALSATVTVTEPPVSFTPAVLSAGAPTGFVPSLSQTLTWTTDVPATCRLSQAPGTAYAAMTNDADTTGATAHSEAVAGLTDGVAATYYVRCLRASNNIANTADYTITFTPDLSAPTGTAITAPAAGTVSGSIPITATATDAGSGIAKIEMYEGANLVCTAFASPFSCDWDTTLYPDGDYSLTAKSYNGSGFSHTSAAVAVTVANAGSGIPPVFTNLVGPPVTSLCDGNQANCTLALTPPDDADKLIVFWGAEDGGTAFSLSSIQYGGTSLTQVATAQAPNALIKAGLRYSDGPFAPGTTQNLVISFSEAVNDVAVVALWAQGIPGAPVDSDTFGNNLVNSAGLVLTGVQTNDVTLAAAVMDDNGADDTWLGASGQEELFDSAFGSAGPSAVMSVTSEYSEAAPSLTASGAASRFAMVGATWRPIFIQPELNLSLIANPMQIEVGGSTTLAWSLTGGAACTASGGWSGSKNAAGGTEVVTPAVTTTYSIDCTGALGSDSDSVTVTVIPASPPPTGTDRYVSTTGVDGAAGTLAAPWRHVQYAWDQATPGMTIHVRAGSYPECITGTKSGTAGGGPITIRNYQSEAVTITDSSNPGCGRIVGADHLKYFTLQGIKIHDTGVASQGFSCYGACQFVRVLSVEVVCEANDSQGNKIFFRDRIGSGAATLHYQGNDIEIHNSTVRYPNNGPDSTRQQDLVITGGFTRFKITNNTVDNHTNIGIDLIGKSPAAWQAFTGASVTPTAPTWPNQGYISGNICKNGGLLGSNSCIYIDGAKDVVIENNQTYDNVGNGVTVSTEDSSFSTSQIITRRNRSWRNTFGIRGMGIINPTSDVRVAHNVVWSNTADDRSYPLGIGSGAIYKNNISVQSDLSGTRHLIHQDGITATPSLNFSMYWQDGANTHWEYKGVLYTSFDTYKSGTGQDPNSSVANPLLTNPAGGDFTLAAGSPAINAGDPLTRTSGGGTGTAITVLDSRWFADGYGVVGMVGDTIRVGTDTVTVTDVNYTTNVLTVTPSITWVNAEPVSYPWLGTAPDIGWHERE